MTNLTTFVGVETRRVVFEGVVLRNEQDVLWLRQVFNQLTNWQEPLLHNHRLEDRGYYYRYPAVQFRVEKGRAVLFGVGEAGCTLIDAFLEREDLPLEFMLSRECETCTHPVRMQTDYQRYALQQWAGLNSFNLARWQADISLRERAALLEGILVNNIFEFCKAVGFTIPDRRLQVRLLDYREGPLVRYPKPNALPFRFKTFDLVYEANLSLPDYLGLGRGKSKGFGWQVATKASRVASALPLNGKRFQPVLKD